MPSGKWRIKLRDEDHINNMPFHRIYDIRFKKETNKKQKKFAEISLFN